VETKQPWERIKELFGAALERDPSERAAFLSQACGQDVSLREEIESLLAAHDSNSPLLEQPLTLENLENSPVRSIGPYRLLSKIGEGGMGQVWLAEQTAPLKRQVALKLIRWGMYDETLLRRFQAERQSLAAMDHPSIAKVFDAGATTEGQPYFVMEYVAGVPITDYCDQKKLKIRDRLELFIKVCDGVQHAHQKAIIHRDLKPANILVVEVDGKPVPRIIDFGLAKAVGTETAGDSFHTRVGGLVGTPGYMSPEQCDSTAQDVDTRTDVYSLGVVLYALLAGNLPFDTAEWKTRPLDEMLRRLREEDAPRPSTKLGSDDDRLSAAAAARGTEARQLLSVVRGDLDWITMKAVERDRTRRYGTPSELAADITRHLNHEPVTARPVSVSYRVQKYVRRHRYTVAVAGVLVGLLLAFAVVQSIQLRKTRRERDRADRIAQFMTGIFRIADPSERVGSAVTARELLDRAAKEVESGLAKDPELQAQMMRVMGIAYLNLGLFSRAQTLLEESIRIGRGAMGEKNPGMQLAMQQLAWTLFSEGRFSEAESLQRKVLEFRRRVLGPDSDDTLSITSDLAQTLDVKGDHKEAEKMSREILAKRMRTLGPENPNTLNALDHLAAILTSQSRFAEAEQLESQALATQRRIFGDERLDTIHYMLNEAAIEGNLGRNKESEQLGRQALEIERRFLGPGQPETAVTLYNLAALDGKNGNTDEAFAFLEQAVDHLPAYALSAIEQDPDLTPLRTDPRFAALVAHAKQVAAAKGLK
jgi:non-specific serine/threonine protein kinase/serine/threonine-protein kinase